jgi:hypothetical protein
MRKQTDKRNVKIDLASLTIDVAPICVGSDEMKFAIEVRETNRMGNTSNHPLVGGCCTIILKPIILCRLFPFPIVSLCLVSL